MPFWLKIDHSWPLCSGPGKLQNIPFIHRSAMSGRRSAGARGGGGGQWGWGNPSGQGRQPAPAAPSRSNAAHNPYEVVMPWFMEPIAETADLEDQSIFVINSVMIAWSLHSKRGWYRRSWPMRRVLSTCSPKETRSCLPAGYHVSLFGNYTLDGIKVVAPRHPG